MRPAHRGSVADTRCFDDETLVALAEGRLGAEERVRLAPPLDACAVCSALVAEIAPDVTDPASRAGIEEKAEASLVSVGSRLGPYVILANAGTGGMGVVYVAYD